MRAIIDRASIAYDIIGSERSLGFLLIHGFPLTGEMWMPLVELLSPEFKMIVPDLRGFGRSEMASANDLRTPTSIAQYADDLAALLDAIGEKGSVVVVGLSMGGYIAFELWRRFPNRVLALVLSDTRSDADSADKRRERHELAERVMFEGTRIVSDPMAQKLFSPRTSPELREQWRQKMAGLDPRGVAAALLAMAGRANSTPLLPMITCPTLVVVGEDDAVTPPNEARAMQQAIAVSQLKVIPGAGHLPPIERPVEVAQAIREFVNEYALAQ